MGFKEKKSILTGAEEKLAHNRAIFQVLLLVLMAFFSSYITTYTHVCFFVIACWSTEHLTVQKQLFRNFFIISIKVFTNQNIFPHAHLRLSQKKKAFYTQYIKYFCGVWPTQMSLYDTEDLKNILSAITFFQTQ